MRNIVFSLSLILIFMIPWENSIVISGLGSLPRLVGIIISAAWIGTVVATGKIRRPHILCLVAGLFVLWQIMSLFWSINVSLSIRRIITYSQLFIMVVLIWDLYTTPTKITAALQAYILGAYISVYYTIQNYLSGNEILYGTGRFSGSGLNANDLALTLAIGIPIAWHLGVSMSVQNSSKKVQILKLLNYAFIPPALFCILLTASRTALFTTLPAFWFILGTSSRLKVSSRVIISLSLISAMMMLQPLIPQSSIDRLNTTSEEIENQDLNGRVDIWREGFPAFLDNPVTGIGSGAYRALTQDNHVAHNTYVTLLVEGGIISFVLFGLMAIIGAYQIWRSPNGNTFLWLIILCILAIGIFVLSWDYRKPTWLIFSLVIVSANTLTQRAPPVEEVTSADNPSSILNAYPTN